MRLRVLIGFLIVLVLALSLSSGAYSELSMRFGTTSSFTGTPIASRTLGVTGPQRGGATTYRGVIAINVATGAIELQGRGLAKAVMGSVRIPRSAIRFCAKTCFGASKWEADVVLETPPMKLQFENAQEIIDWCWRERVPILPTGAELAWLYEHGRLPDPSTFSDQFSSRSVFDEAVHKSCVGI